MKKSILFKNLILAGLCFSFIFACSSPTAIDYSVAEAKLLQDYEDEKITGIDWSTQRGYQIANFTASARSLNQGKSMTAWYYVSGTTATRKMDLENIGTTVPASIKVAFNETKYNDANKWRIEEIELEHIYANNGTFTKRYYEMELQSVLNSNLEAELFFSYEEGKDGSLLFSKEELDDDDDDDDKFVINAQLTVAVEAAVPGAQIIDAEVDDNIIEVEAIMTITAGVVESEIDLEFSMNYDLISKVIEKEYTYSTIPADFNVIKTWFSNVLENTANIPAPTADAKVTIAEGEQSEDGINYYYEVEIDDYTTTSTIKYELEFYLSKNHEILDVDIDEE